MQHRGSLIPKCEYITWYNGILILTQAHLCNNYHKQCRLDLIGAPFPENDKGLDVPLNDRAGSIAADLGDAISCYRYVAR